MYLELVIDEKNEWQEFRIANETIYANHSISAKKLLEELDKYHEKYTDKYGCSPLLRGIIVRDA